MNLKEFHQLRKSCPVCGKDLVFKINGKDVLPNEIIRVDIESRNNKYVVFLGYSKQFIKLLFDYADDNTLSITLISVCHHFDNGSTTYYLYGGTIKIDIRAGVLVSTSDIENIYEFLNFDHENLNIAVATFRGARSQVTVTYCDNLIRLMPKSSKFEMPGSSFIDNNSLTFESLKNRIIKLLPLV